MPSLHVEPNAARRPAAYYPDVLVVCGPAWHRLYERDATVIVDVLSPSTESTDRREKASAYALLPGLRQYVLVDPDPESKQRALTAGRRRGRRTDRATS